MGKWALPGAPQASGFGTRATSWWKETLTQRRAPTAGDYAAIPLDLESTTPRPAECSCCRGQLSGLSHA